MVVLRWDPPLPSLTIRTTKVITPVPVRTPAEGGAALHAGYAGTVRSAEKFS
jgi:hypothetical protein